MYRNPRRDSGAVLVLTLILVVIMSVIVLALLQYVTVALRTADVATARTDSNADSANVMQWAIEEFGKKQLTPDDDCGAAPTYIPVPYPTDLASNGSSTTLQCAQTNPINGDEPVIHLIATSTGRQARVIETTLEIPRYSHGARVADWRVDIPIVVPTYTTTTTSVVPTTSTTVPNNAPYAPDIFVNLGLDDSPTTLTLPAADPDGDPMTVVSAVPTNPPATPVTIGSGFPPSISIEAVSPAATVGGSYTIDYVVEDDSGASSNVGVITVVVDASPTTTTTSIVTTTTVAPAPLCSFVVTSAQNGGNTGIGQLEVSNTGSDFTGWTVELTQKSSSKPWQFTWGPGVTATIGSSTVVVSGGQTVTSTSPFFVTAGLTQSGGNPKIAVNDTLTCVVTAP